MLIHETTFNIRQYYLVTSVYPLEIWMYKDCYLSFTSQKFTLKSFHESVHQTSNAAQRKYKNCFTGHNELPKHHLWNLQTYKNYLHTIEKGKVWNKYVYTGMKKSIIGIMLSSQSSMPFPYEISKKRFGLYGCDFVLDKEYKPWLMEIKCNPDLNSTNAITSSFYKRIMRDVLKGKIDRTIYYNYRMYIMIASLKSIGKSTAWMSLFT